MLQVALLNSSIRIGNLNLCSTVGWGRLSERLPTSQTLRSVVVPIWSQDECTSAGYGSTRITSNMMCGGFPEGEKDACQVNKYFVMRLTKT